MKKLLLVVLALMMVLGTVTGCATKTSSLDTKKIDEIIWYYPGEKQADTQMVVDKINERLQPEVGAKLVLKSIDSSAYKEKMALIVASGEKFDICFVANWSFPFYSNVTSGAFMPITDLIDKYGPKLKTELPEYLWKSTTIDDDIYAVPNYQILPTEFSLNIPEKLAKKYNFDFSNAKDIKDFEPFLKTVKDNEPNLYPFKPVYSNIEMKYEQVYPTNFVVVDKNDQNLKAYNSFELNEFKDYMHLMRDWYQKGYIRKDVLGADKDTAADLGLKYGFSWGTIKPGGDVEARVKYGEDIKSISMCEPYIQTSATARTLSAISRTSEHPEKAVKVLELMNTDKELYNLLVFGIEGVHYDKVSDTTIKPKQNSNYKLNAWMFGNQFNAYFTQGQTEDTWEKTKTLNENAKLSPMWGFNFNSDPVKNEITQCSAVIKEFEYIKLGVEDPDQSYNSFIEKLKVAGSDKVVAEVQKQLDEWKAQNK